MIKKRTAKYNPTNVNRPVEIKRHLIAHRIGRRGAVTGVFETKVRRTPGIVVYVRYKQNSWPMLRQKKQSKYSALSMSIPVAVMFYDTLHKFMTGEKR